MARFVVSGFFLFQAAIAASQASAQGRLDWARRFDTPSRGEEYARAMDQDGAGNIYIAGHVTPNRWLGFGAGAADAILVKLSPDGDPLWASRFDAPGVTDHEPVAIALDSDGAVVVAVNINPTFENSDVGVLKYDARGNLLWSAPYDSPQHWIDRVEAIAAVPGGAVYVAGNSWSPGGGPESDVPSAVINKYTPAGQIAWTASLAGHGNDSARANLMAVDAAGDLVIAGSFQAAGRPTEAAAAKLDANGKRLWMNRYDAGSGAGELLWEERYGGAPEGTSSASALAVEARATSSSPHRTSTARLSMTSSSSSSSRRGLVCRSGAGTRMTAARSTSPMPSP